MRARAPLVATLDGDGQNDPKDIPKLLALFGEWPAPDMVAGERGTALVPGALAHIECGLVASHAAGDHTIYVGEVQTATVADGRPLLFFKGKYNKLPEQ